MKNIVNRSLKEKNLSLSIQIKREITNRIFLCFLVLFLFVLIISYYDAITSKEEIKRIADEKCTSIKNFIISQTLIDNDRV